MANAVTVFLDDHLANGGGARPAITTPTERATYRELYALAGRAGHALRALGVEPEQRVAILLPNGLEWAAARLPAYQRPRRIVVVEDLPRTPTGKLPRCALRARAERLA